MWAPSQKGGWRVWILLLPANIFCWRVRPGSLLWHQHSEPNSRCARHLQEYRLQTIRWQLRRRLYFQLWSSVRVRRPNLQQWVLFGPGELQEQISTNQRRIFRRMLFQTQWMCRVLSLELWPGLWKQRQDLQQWVCTRSRKLPEKVEDLGAQEGEMWSATTRWMVLVMGQMKHLLQIGQYCEIEKILQVTFKIRSHDF